ncbi:vitronectin b [Megalops cyprinoides]|uniref:vitronectin b n=1 Tax=Megalops cyprinoides TaxID=118141 RepID=UPI0018649FF0|nr:vitronectin b [Megalops cyprinoides]
MSLWGILLLAVLATAFAAEENCAGRCDKGFDATKKCQCDSMCGYYGSCCADYDTTCRTKIARGDTFHDPDDEIEAPNTTLATTTVHDTSTPTPTPTPTPAVPTKPLEPEADPCSGRTFDSFMQLKNGSIYAFRGEYFFELDERSVLPGYPKLIKDVWGISGPIDAAFTRINCQGKTYIFKGNKYWRFDGDVLDDDYPRDISVGFEKIPDDVDAAFALPATSHHGKEKVYFFKGDRYYLYEFKHQPTHEECAQISKTSPSLLFTQYTDVYCDKWTDLFSLLFEVQGHHHGPRFISKDWVGIKSPVDAAMAGRLYIAPRATPAPTPAPALVRSRSRSARRRKGRRNRGRGQRGQRRRQARSLWDTLEYLFDYDYMYDPMDFTEVEVVEEKSQPVQNVYFFKKDKYYRVDLQTKRVDYANPPYPRSIAKYWLGCKAETGAEKK